MTQLIDKEGVFEAVKWCADELDIEVVQRFIEILSNQPIVYEVPVIRCKDCKYYTGKWCTKFSTKQFDINDIRKADDDFCSMAERKEE